MRNPSEHPQAERSSRLRALWLGLALSTLAVLAATAYPSSALAAATVRFMGSGFSPMVIKVLVGTTITFKDTVDAALELTSAPTAPEAVSRRVPAKGQAGVRFDKTGVYLLYDAATTGFGTKTFDGTKVEQVIAKEKSPNFPMPAYAVVVAIDKNGGGIPPTAPEVTIPMTSMTFVPWVTVVKAGTPITFVNKDEDVHVVMPAPEVMLMPRSSRAGKQQQGYPELGLERMNLFPAITLTGNGGTRTLTLTQLGVHHYYCPLHAVFSPQNSSYAPLKSYGGYPYVMDGIVVVVP